jgi:ADP-ribose pyrophosphatase
MPDLKSNLKAASLKQVNPAAALERTPSMAVVVGQAQRVDKAKKGFKSIHVKARSQHPAYPVRAEVEDKDVAWEKSAPQYEAVEFTHKVVFANDSTKERGNGNNGWADPPDPANPAIDWSKRESYEGPMQFFPEDHAPINPRGRTGMHGRGLLGKWGPNHAADPIVTRFDPARPDVLQVVAIKRKDTGDWALPGGMIDAGEKVSLTVKREFEEEAGNLADFPELQRQFKASVDELFASGKEVYRVRAAARTLRLCPQLLGPQPGTPTPIRVAGLRGRPPQHGQCLDGDDGLPLSLHRGARPPDAVARGHRRRRRHVARR